MKFGLFAIGQATGCGRCGRKKSRHAKRSSVLAMGIGFYWCAGGRSLHLSEVAEKKSLGLPNIGFLLCNQV